MAEGCVTAVEFDLNAHRAQLLRELGQRNRLLEAERARLERVLGLALDLWTRGSNCGQLALLDVLEQLEREDSRLRAEWLALLRPLPYERRRERQ
jgi:hypothetical protein